MQNPLSFSVVIADSSRLGSVMLERLLAPLLDVVVCPDEASLDLALRRRPAMLMVANLWPGLDGLLTDVTGSGGPAVILMASPDSDAARIASLSTRFGTGVIYRPYEARQVMREMLGLLSTEATTIPTATEVVPVLATTHDPLEMVQRDQAFCRRHHLPHSLLALRIDEYASLQQQLGADGLAQAENSICTIITDSLRREDHLCEQAPGRLVLSLPGTPPQGARVLAHRLCQQIQNQEIEAAGLMSHFALLAGIHVVGTGQDLADDIAQAISASELANSEDGLTVLLTDSACDQLSSATPPLLKSGEDDFSGVAPHATQAQDPWQHIAAMLDESDAETSRDAMQQLTGLLRRLDEDARMTLVDELLLASAMPD
jgi:GGDEF domain-containing protein